ncbi:MAG: metalloregulator ArsR/SmtB family transcription factor [Alphaproteobacteria bacterium]|nr:metalloregulator ArsR/SmtB family transcription factor [Alphaproteobacteria bacterium]
MEITSAVDALGALAHDTRLRVFQLVIATGPAGISAGAIAREVGVPASTLSHHLGLLERAALVRSWRQARQILYAADEPGIAALLGFLTQQCCGGRPELCQPTALALPVALSPPPRLRRPVMSKVYSVLFLCNHNSARSIMAEQILTRVGMGRFRAFSAGSHPTGRINPFVAELLTKLGYDLSNARSKTWEEFATPDAPQLDFVITVCDQAAGEVCPIWPGQPMTAHWGFPDPSAATGSDAEKAAFTADVYRMIQRRLEAFANLPIASLDSLTLQTRMDSLGEAESAAQ